MTTMLSRDSVFICSRFALRCVHMSSSIFVPSDAPYPRTSVGPISLSSLASRMQATWANMGFTGYWCALAGVIIFGVGSVKIRR